jgi:hypothetical protein
MVVQEAKTKELNEGGYRSYSCCRTTGDAVQLAQLEKETRKFCLFRYCRQLRIVLLLLKIN